VKKSLVFVLIMAADQGLAYQTASNHSYLKNSTFANNHAVDIRGYGDLKSLYLKESTENIRIKFESDLSISINLHAESSEILKYGIKIIPSFNNHFGDHVSYHAFIDSYYGKFEFGSPLDVTENLRIGADSIAVGPSAINGDIAKHLPKQQNNLGSFIFGPGTLMNQNFGCHELELERKYWNNSKYLAKINYYSPDIYGLQLGLGLTPNVRLTGENLYAITAMPNNNNNFPLGSFFGASLSFIKAIWDVGLALSVAQEFNWSNPIDKIAGVSEKAVLNSRSYDFGISISYFGLTLAASYGLNSSGKLSGQAIGNIRNEKKNGNYRTYGGAYEFGSFSTSVTRFESKLEENRFGSTSYGVRVNLAKGLAIYAEYSDYFYEHEAVNYPAVNQNQVKEKGYEAIIGILVDF
jgi:hypothetical protein